MATIRKHKKKYQVIIRRKDHPHIYKSFISLEAAREWARDTEVNIERGLYANLNAALSMTLKNLLESYRENVTPSKRGHKEESYKIGKLIRLDIANSAIAKLTVLKLKKFQKELENTHKPSTINKYVSLIKMALDYAVNDLDIYLPKNVASQVKRLKESDWSGEIISNHEEKKLVQASYKSKAYWLRAALIMGIDTGARRSEILRLRKKWSGVNKTFKSTRATFSTRAAESGWNHLDIASQTGHKDLNVLKKHYTFIDARYLAKKLDN